MFLQIFKKDLQQTAKLNIAKRHVMGRWAQIILYVFTFTFYSLMILYIFNGIGRLLTHIKHLRLYEKYTKQNRPKTQIQITIDNKYM